ncbi:MAG: hypothetical protein AVDCRST_MAG61-953, partial [uncultured Friedmanniella sp.]
DRPRCPPASEGRLGGRHYDAWHGRPRRSPLPEPRPRPGHRRPDPGV